MRNKTESKYDKLDQKNRTKCEIWTRAMGYCRPVANFNKGKKSEFYERKYFVIERKIKNDK